MNVNSDDFFTVQNMRATIQNIFPVESKKYPKFSQ